LYNICNSELFSDSKIAVMPDVSYYFIRIMIGMALFIGLIFLVGRGCSSQRSGCNMNNNMYRQHGSGGILTC